MKRKYLFGTLWMLIFSVSVLTAQTGVVKGIVKEAGANSTLPGATVYIEGTNVGVVTDVDGAYVLGSVPAGT
ncbi:MAG: carboxypeptidase-like regulatory domain-containing protein, partial [Bacteroidota bacterium]